MAEEDLARRKAMLRLKARAARRAISPEMREAAAHAIADRVLALPEMRDVRAVLVYGASPEEADPGPLEAALRADGVRIAYPRVAGVQGLALHWVDDHAQLVTGSFGLRQPTETAERAHAEDIDAIIVPGVAFDARCGRLGYGRGYFDALLSGSCQTIPTIGIAFDEQIVDEVPCDEGDWRLSAVVTPTRALRPTTRL
ncbi:MAG: 5-formyltetrahydrofolate cyclo-ligase [Coriobacteriia bacterium]